MNKICEDCLKLTDWKWTDKAIWLFSDICIICGEKKEKVVEISKLQKAPLAES